MSNETKTNQSDKFTLEELQEAFGASSNVKFTQADLAEDSAKSLCQQVQLEHLPLMALANILSIDSTLTRCMDELDGVDFDVADALQRQVSTTTNLLLVYALKKTTLFNYLEAAVDAAEFVEAQEHPSPKGRSYKVDLNHLYNMPVDKLVKVLD